MSGIVGKPAPPFELDAVLNGEFKKIRLADYQGRWLVVFFYPLDFTFVCPTEILAFSDRLGEFQAIQADVLGVSVDSKYSHLAWTEKPRAEGGIQGLAYPLLADINKRMASDYDVLTEAGVALRGLFLIDSDGTVQHATVNNMSVGRSVDETLRVLKAFQYVAEHGEVCPANWEPGSASMKANWKDSKEYFSTQGSARG